MKITLRQIIARGLRSRCPNCGARSLFEPGVRLQINRECPRCGLKFDRGEGFFLGPFVINYTVTVVIYVIPVIFLYIFGLLSMTTTIVAAGIGALLLPFLFYRWSWSWWLMLYFYFLPQKLPANRDPLHEDEEE
jgi:uncharacterized protein (DUF983 family)